jgi:hypothetical protein
LKNDAEGTLSKMFAGTPMAGREVASLDTDISWHLTIERQTLRPWSVTELETTNIGLIIQGAPSLTNRTKATPSDHAWAVRG